MSLTGAQVLQGFSEFIRDFKASTTTSNGNSAGTTLVDTYLCRYGDGQLTGSYIRLTSGTYTLAVRRILDNTQSTGTVTLANTVGGQIVSGVTYQLHKYDPDEKFLAIEKARIESIDEVYRLIYDETITSDGKNYVYDIPTTIGIGPTHAVYEEPLSPTGEWNFISDPEGDSTSNWTASSVTASLYTRTNNDLLIPKYNDSCTKLVTAGSTAATYSQTVANMTNGITAALAADREMTFAAWVYCTEASKIRVRILDDSGTLATSSYHQGKGWELLTVEGTIAGNNNTTLTAQFVIESTANASTIYWNHAWFYFGKKELVSESIYSEEHIFGVRSDEATQHVILGTVPPKGRQVRLIGKTAVSSLGTVAASQITNTMELTSGTAELLYARAAKILYLWEQVDTDNLNEVQARLQAAQSKLKELESPYAQTGPNMRIRSAFSN